MIRQTSILAYDYIKKTGKPVSDQMLYLDLLQTIGQPSTDREVAMFGGVDVMRMERRRNELVKEGIVVSVGVRRCNVSNRLCHIWWFA